MFVDSFSNSPSPRFPAVEAWAKKLVDECQSALSIVLPFRKNEIEFLDQIQRNGKVLPELISSDPVFSERVRKHPLLHWRVRQSISN
jgi:hypothetical protein